MTPPNLFFFATSELSQDAALAYFLAWADPKFKPGGRMHVFGVHLLNSMLVGSGNHHPNPKAVQVERQKGNIDLLVLVESDGNKTALLIEDKTYSEVHNPLDKYLDYVKEEYPAYDNYVGVILSLGNQVSHSPHDKFKRFTRKDLTEAFKKFPDPPLENTVFENFRNHVVGHHEKFEIYRSRQPANEWSWEGWEGFFEHLCTSESGLFFNEYRYVNNESGGLRACYWRSPHVFTFKGQNVYLQIDYTSNDNEGKIIFKMGVAYEDHLNNKGKGAPEKIKISQSESVAFYQAIEQAALSQGYRTLRYPGYGVKAANEGQILQRPNSIRGGEYTTCALIRQKDWFKNLTDYQQAIRKLHEFQDFFISIPEVKRKA